MNPVHRHNLLQWLGLLILGAAEFGASFLPIPADIRPLLILPAILMALLVALGFMQLLSAPAIARCFAVAGLFWLIVLLGLSMMDPLTRAVYHISR